MSRYHNNNDSREEFRSYDSRNYQNQHPQHRPSGGRYSPPPRHQSPPRHHSQHQHPLSQQQQQQQHPPPSHHQHSRDSYHDRPNHQNGNQNHPRSHDDRDRGGGGVSRGMDRDRDRYGDANRGGGGGGGGDSVSRYRQDHESETEWRLRRSFIERNSDRLEGDHLLSMASAYVNVEMMGNRYPKPVMDRLSELSSGLNDDYKEQKKSRLNQQFVAASDAKKAEKRKMMGEADDAAPSSSNKKFISFARSTVDADQHFSCDNSKKPTNSSSPRDSVKKEKDDDDGDDDKNGNDDNHDVDDDDRRGRRGGASSPSSSSHQQRPSSPPSSSSRSSPPTSRLRSCVVTANTVASSTTTTNARDGSGAGGRGAASSTTSGEPDVRSRLQNIASEGNGDDDDDDGGGRFGGLGLGGRPGLGSGRPGLGSGSGLGFVSAGSNGNSSYNNKGPSNSSSSSPYGNFSRPSFSSANDATSSRGGLGFGGGGGGGKFSIPFARPAPSDEWRHDFTVPSTELDPEVSSLLVKQFKEGFVDERKNVGSDRSNSHNSAGAAAAAKEQQPVSNDGMGPPVIGYRQRHSMYIEKKMADLVFIMKNEKAKVLMNPHGQLGNICVKEKLKLDVVFVKTYKQLADSQKHGKWNKSKRPIEYDIHVFELVIEGVIVTEFEDRNKPAAKNNCLRQGVEIFANSCYLKVDQDSRGRQRLYTWDDWRKAPEGAYRYDFLCKAAAKSRFGGGPIGVVGGGVGGGGRGGGGGGQGSSSAGPKGDISQLVILENENLDGRPDVSPSMILQQSAAFCNLDLRMDTASLSTSGQKGLASLLICKIFIQDHYIAEGKAHNMPVAKQVASANALRKLKQLCPTLLKKGIASDNPDVVYSEVATKAVKQTGITRDNPGLKMMLKMGWGGGGLGAEEEGIQEPVNVEEQIIDRQGFGFRQANGISTDFLTNIRKTLEEFSRSDRKERLVFSRGFTNDERKEIHNIARRCGLKSKSAGKSHNRQLMVWRKKGTTLQLIQHMIQSGGETDLYKLIPPPWCLTGMGKPPRLEDL